MTSQPDRPDGDELITPEMAIAGRKALAVVANRMEEAKLLATSSIDFWQRVGHEPANEIYRAMLSAATPQSAPDAMRELADKIRFLHNRKILGPVMGGYQISDDECATIVALLSAPVPSPDRAASADDIRAQGWTVAVHNDYRQDGQAHTFWLFTKGRENIKGEGRTDAEALNQVRAALPASGAGAAEPAAQMLEYARRLNDIATTCEIDGMRGHASDLRRIAQQIVAAPPVRGDREETIRECANIARFGAKDCTDGDTDWHKGFRYAANATALEIESAILSLSSAPVSDDALADLVSRFSRALLAKLKLAQANGRSGWERDDWERQCQQGLLRHVDKGDPRDVAAYCAFLWHHGWITSAEPVAALRDNLREAWSALSMIRETVETLGPIGSMAAAEHLEGPTLTHEANNIVKGICAIASRFDRQCADFGLKWSQSYAAGLADGTTSPPTPVSGRDAVIEALKPFADFGCGEDDGDIRDGLMRDRICDWFGPSDFDAARVALSSHKEGGR